MKKKAVSILVNLFKVGFAAGIITWLIRSGAIDLSVFKLFLSPEKILISLFGIFFTFILATERWRKLLSVQNIHSTFHNCFQLTTMGMFFNYVVPGGVGGDVVKAFYIIKESPHQKMGAGVSVLLDRVLGLYAMMIMCCTFILLDWARVSTNQELKIIAQILFLLFFGFTLALILAFSKKFKNLGWQEFLLKPQFNKLEKVIKKLLSAFYAVHAYGSSLKVVAEVIVLSLLAQISSIFVFVYLGNVSGFDVPWLAYFFVVPLGFMVTAVPISPAGVGVGQMAFYFLFNMYLNEKSQVGPTLITIFQILNFIMSLLGAFYFIRRRTTITTGASN